MLKYLFHLRLSDSRTVYCAPLPLVVSCIFPTEVKVNSLAALFACEDELSGSFRVENAVRKFRPIQGRRVEYCVNDLGSIHAFLVSQRLFRSYRDS
jgi:hypothetical protein